MSERAKAFVTNRELDEKLDKLPSRWEVRFLILAGFLGSQFVPAHDVANAAVNALPF